MKWGSLLLCAWMILLAAWPFADKPGLQIIAVFLAGMYAQDFASSSKSCTE